jgi:hypothetical protein
MAQGSGMKRVSGTAARCNEFFPQVLPLSLIFVAAVKTRTTKAGRPLNRLWRTDSLS